MAESAVRALLRWGSQGWWPDRVSLSSIHAMEVSGVDEGCVLRLEVLPDTSSPDGEHKVRTENGRGKEKKQRTVLAGFFFRLQSASAVDRPLCEQWTANDAHVDDLHVFFVFHFLAS